jgi:hypothetical protein
LNYSYTDNSGMTRLGALNIPYATSAANTVVATAAPAGEINAVEKSGAQPVAVTFTTDDGKAASGLYITSNLAALPAGWSSGSRSFSCAGVSTGNGCQLHLTYTPAALTSGTLTLDYAYTDGGGVPQTGSLNLNYAATTNDNAVATAAPTGQIYTVAPGSVPVSVTFTTDDAREATALQVTSGLSALPAGWSSTASSFSCSGFSSGTGCQLLLTYAPTLAASGTLILSYTYLNNAGQSKSGSVNIAYRATTNDLITGTANPASPTVSISSGMPVPVTVTFITDDGNPASALSIASSLGTLPSDWSGPGSFSCASVSTGSGCALNLIYAPSAVETGTLSLNFTYNDNSGTPKTGSVSIPYSATP